MSRGHGRDSLADLGAGECESRDPVGADRDRDQVRGGQSREHQKPPEVEDLLGLREGRDDGLGERRAGD